MKTTALRIRLAVLLALLPIDSPLLQAQPVQNTAAPGPDQPQSAASRPSFDVASVKVNNTPFTPTGPRPSVTIEGGLFSATLCTLTCLLSFAYDLGMNDMSTVVPQLPKQMASQRFDVKARAAGNPSKDQVRLMLRSLLVDRFRFAMHYETRQLALYNLVLAKPGKLGPQMQPYGNEPPCATAATPAPSVTIAGGFPAACGGPRFLPSNQPGLVRVGSRNMSMQQLADTLGALGGLDRPVLDRTGLAGNIDFLIEWDRKDVTNPTAEATGPTFVEALQDQLGLKLESDTGRVKTFVIDHIEEPSPN